MSNSDTEKFIRGFVQGVTTAKTGRYGATGGYGSPQKDGALVDTPAAIAAAAAAATAASSAQMMGGQVDNQPLVLCGPVIGTVTDTTANVLLEIDCACMMTCTATPVRAGQPVSDTRPLKQDIPEAFKLQNLKPETEYTISFDPMAPVQTKELQARGCVVRTLPADKDVKTLRLIALSCDRPAEMKPHQENPWGRVAKLAKAGKCDVMLHLGDQVYTKENNWKAHSMQILDICDKAWVTESVRTKAERQGANKLSDAYRSTWYYPEVAAALSHSSHLMIWSDNDVANDFTVLKDDNGNQAYTPSFLRVGMRVYRMYQRQLWDPDCQTSGAALETRKTVEEWHFHRYGPCGVFLIDMRGNRITGDGHQKDGPIMSRRQRDAIEDAFRTPGLTCMLVCSEIPFVGDPHDVIVQKAKKIPFLVDHWPYAIDELTWLLDLCFAWKAAMPGREVIMLGGDIHVSVDSVIEDTHTRQKIRHITTSPITNHVCGFYPALEGKLNDRYAYTHKEIRGARTFCTIDLNFEGGQTAATVELVAIPAEDKEVKHVDDVLVVCGPVIGAVTDTTANVMLEVDANAQITCTATPVGGGGTVADARELKANLPEVFVLKDLKPGTEYKISFSPLAPVQRQELQDRGCMVRTMPGDLRKLRVIALSCDRPNRMLPQDENPWGRLADICKKGECDVMLHLGDQVYTKENDWMGAAIRAMDICEAPGATPAVIAKAEHNGSMKLQEAYRGTWYPKEVAQCLSHSSHHMIWSDNDVANDFTILKNKDGSQAYSPSFLRVGMRVYRMYQRQLWDPECVLSEKALLKQPEVEEWHFHTYGTCGIFLIDMRGNRIGTDGIQKEGPILSARQKKAIEDAFSTPGLTCMLVCSEIPFVGDPPSVIHEKQKKCVFLADHWPYQVAELTWLLDLCFSFKAAASGREVVMLGGDIHVSVDSTISDKQTGLNIRHITTSPVTNHVCGFYPDLKGEVNERYSYEHKPLPDMRTYCTVDLDLSNGQCTSEVNLVGIPATKEH